MEVETLSCAVNEALSLKLMPTEQCNFRCITCLEDSSLGRMPESVVLGVKNLINAHLPEIKYLFIDWMGGEPLIAKDIIYDISDYILSAINKPGIKYVSTLSTDGFQLNVDTFKQLLSKEVRSYQIFLDEPIGKYRKTKHRIEGFGSFAQIWHNILSMKAVDDDFKIMIKIPVTLGNYSTLRELCENITKEFDDDQRFSVSFRVVDNHGVGTDGNLTKILQEIKELTGVDIYSLSPRPNNIVIRTDGTITREA